MRRIPMRFLVVGGLLALMPACYLEIPGQETPEVESRCGDGVADWQTGEDCDGAAELYSTCLTLGYYNETGTLRCGPDCRYDTSDCGGTCHDGVADLANGEECDGEDFAGQTCESLNRGGGVLRCLGNCRLQYLCEGKCGNGLREESEACEDGNLEPGDGCGPSCEVETGWECWPYHEISRCGVDCGDGLAFGDEECDQDDLRGETCESLGFSGGVLDCTFFTCQFNMMYCVE